MMQVIKAIINQITQNILLSVTDNYLLAPIAEKSPMLILKVHMKLATSIPTALYSFETPLGSIPLSLKTASAPSLFPVPPPPEFEPPPPPLAFRSLPT